MSKEDWKNMKREERRRNQLCLVSYSVLLRISREYSSNKLLYKLGNYVSQSPMQTVYFFKINCIILRWRMATQEGNLYSFNTFLSQLVVVDINIKEEDNDVLPLSILL